MGATSMIGMTPTETLTPGLFESLCFVHAVTIEAAAKSSTETAARVLRMSRSRSWLTQRASAGTVPRSSIPGDRRTVEDSGFATDGGPDVDVGALRDRRTRFRAPLAGRHHARV